MKFIVSLLMSALISGAVVAQTEDKFIQKGEKLFSEGSYAASLEFFEQAYNINPKNADLNYKIGLAYLKSTYKVKALKYLLEAEKLMSPVPLELYFNIGRAYHVNLDFAKAAEYYKKSDPNNINKKVVSKALGECEFAKKFLAAPKPYKIANLGDKVNTQLPEYYPHITSDFQTMYFTGRRPDSKGGKLEVDGIFFEDIYQCLNRGGAWDEPRNLSNLNSDGHDACIGLSKDGQTMFVYKGTNGGDIYISELDGERWGTPKPVPFNTEFFESSVSISADGKKMYFVRNAAGQKDILMCSKGSSGNWSKPVKMGSNINTEYDEESPFIHDDGKTLYFSSKGHNSMGGYDIFKTVYGPGGWSKPENLGAPINSVGDDIYFTLAADGRIGFFSSENAKDGFGKQDLYTVTMPLAAKAPDLVLLKGKVEEEIGGEPIEAKITVVNNATREVVATMKSNSKSGKYMISLPAGVNYNVTIEKDGHLFQSNNIQLDSNAGFKELVNNVKLMNVKAGSKIILNNIFFDTGKDALKAESMEELDRLVKMLKEHLALKIEIAGHTDNRGDEKANQQLSQSRAKNVVNYLVTNGIAKERLTFKGYGSSKGIASNDTEEGRKQNRRTEFTIIE
jgi:outer membrane protein OmpA-like peptidoglycan-associated protein